ncbi:MAG: undecaprenyl-phosphate glucose phosphotransferase [Caldilineales bacterium]|nr:undecaprenyl-phosphate glucose phosphotransferase [Caldilineales bacterium]
MNRARFVFVIVTLATDIVAICAAVFTAHRLQRLVKPDSVDRLLAYAPYLLLLIGATLLVLYFYRRYHRRQPQGLINSLSAVAGPLTIANLIVLAGIAFFLRTPGEAEPVNYPRAFPVYAWAFSILYISLGRFFLARIFAFLQARHVGRDRVLVVGTGEVGRMLVQKLQSAGGIAHEVVGFVDTNPESPTVVGVPALGHPADLPAIIETHSVDEVVIGLPEGSHRQLVQLIALCEREKVSIKVFPDVFQIMATEVSVSDLAGLPLLTVRDVALRGWRLSMKRGYDLLFGGLMLIFFSPLMLFIALLIKLESPGPIFYIQERMGLDARPFPMLKFRSMRSDAEKQGPGWTTANDPRKTRLGALLRRISFDELPQLINVVRGDMSLVGPRPERPVYVEQFRQVIPRYMERHREKAGLTGWAQVNGLRGDTSIVERTKYDLWYIENWSLWLDFKICVQTAFRLFSDRNAY